MNKIYAKTIAFKEINFKDSKICRQIKLRDKLTVLKKAH